MKTLSKDEPKLTSKDEAKTRTFKKAEYCADSIKMATAAIRNIYDPCAFVTGDLDNSPDIEHLHGEIKKQITEVLEGNTSRTETMLMAQAKTLELLFNSMINRSLSASHFDSVRYHMEIALRAQNQCRKTLLALEAIKNPPQKQIVGQQNIALNQQVNNGVLGNTTSKPGRQKIKPENELLENVHGKRLDTTTSSASINDDPQMEAVGTINGCENISR